MLLNQKTKIKLSKKNLDHFRTLGYEGELKDIIDVNTMDINCGSHLLIDVKCDICGDVKKISFQKYVKNVKNGGFYACSSGCAQKKVKKTNLEKFGFEYYTQTKEYKDRVLETSLKNYGCKHFTQNDEVKNKIRETNIERYGEDSLFKSEIIKDKIKVASIKKYGVDNVFKSEVIKEKMRKTFNKKYGVDWSSKSKIVKDKQKKTMMEKYGVDNIFKLDWIKEKSKKSYFDKYGVPFGIMTYDMISKMKENKKKKWLNKILEQNQDLKYISTNDNEKYYIFDIQAKL